MPLEVTLLVNLKKLVGEEKLTDAEKAVFNAFVEMGLVFDDALVYKNAENMECVLVRGNNIIKLTIYADDKAEIEVVHNYNDVEYSGHTLEGVLNNVMDTIATTLGIEKDKVVDAIEHFDVNT
jgi:hypothetical protein